MTDACRERKRRPPFVGGREHGQFAEPSPARTCGPRGGPQESRDVSELARRYGVRGAAWTAAPLLFRLRLVVHDHLIVLRERHGDDVLERDSLLLEGPHHVVDAGELLPQLRD